MEKIELLHAHTRIGCSLENAIEALNFGTFNCVLSGAVLRADLSRSSDPTHVAELEKWKDVMAKQFVKVGHMCRETSTSIHAGRQTGRHAQIHRIDRQTDRQIDRQTDRQTGIQTDRQTDRRTDRQAGRQTDRPTDRQTDR
jgi:hypothetical protein